MQLDNPQRLKYGHENFNGQFLTVALNSTPIDAIGVLEVTPPGQGTANVQVQAQDNGHIKLRVVQGGPVTVVVVDGNGDPVFEG